ncbi:flavocytochrome c [Desulfobulbus sp. TB]|nr:flavocytochrome c [Desulfobulbus sp. TB]
MTREDAQGAEKVDVLVVGSGFAGLSAAIEAALAGCSVLIIEKRNSYGGNSWISGGVLAAVDVETQQQHGIQDSTAQMFYDMMQAGRWRNDPDLVQLICTQSYNVLQWLRQELGVRFMEGRIDQFGGHSVPRCHTVLEIEGRNICRPLLQRVQELRIDVRLQTSMTRILQDYKGRLVGCECQEESGKNYRVQTQALILASGGFTAEKETGNHKHTVSSTTLPDCTGEIVKLLQGLNADMVDLDQVQLLPGASPDEHGRGGAPMFTSYVVFPYGIMLDVSTGRRFVNEWADRKTRSEAILALQQPAIGIADQNGIDNVGEMIHMHMDEAVIRRFENLEDISAAYQLPTDELRKSIELYNQHVEQKNDTSFGKPIPSQAKPLEPPYYALRLWPKAHFNLGGVRINTQSQVLNCKGEVISGLFAAGEVTGGVHGVSRLSACAITECLVMGRVAGQQAAFCSKKLVAWIQ